MEEMYLTTEREAGAFIHSLSMARGSGQGETAVQAAAAGDIFSQRTSGSYLHLTRLILVLSVMVFHTSKYSSLTYYE